jgi:probable F420-dependent oxidoreductase
MKFCVTIPIDHPLPEGEFQTPETARELAAAVEASGVAACCLTDHPAPSSHWLHNTSAGHDALDPFTGLAYVAALTNRVKLVSNIIVLPYRSPFVTAKASATLQVLSGGRFILGVGAGYQKVEFEALGVPFEKRGALTDEALETIRLAWAGGPVVKQGRFFNAAENEPRPVPSPPPPIWVGGGSDKAVERAARFGDAWQPVFFPVKDEHRVSSGSGVQSIGELREKWARLQDLRARLGRTGPFELALAVPQLPGLESPELGAYLEILETLRDAGAAWATLSLPAPSRNGYLENLAWVSEEILPRFAEA